MNERHEFHLLGKELTFDPAAVLPGDQEHHAPCINSLALDVSGSCNLGCAYCAESATLPDRGKMPQLLIDLAIDRLFDWSAPSAPVSIHLGSGEPLLQSEAVVALGRKAGRLARGRNRRLSLYLTTNGTLLSDALDEELVAGGWSVKVSLDGSEEDHNRCRRDKDGRGTFRRIERHVKDLARRMPESFSTTSVLCRGTDPQRVFFDIASMGVRRIELVPVAATGSSNLSLTDEDMAAYGIFIADYARRLAAGEDLPTNIRFQKRLQKVLGYGNSSTPCGAGRNFIAVGPEGDLYPCFRFVGLDDYRLGDLHSGLNAESVQRFAQGAARPFTERSCRDCWAGPICGGPCYACSELLWSGSISPDYCSMVRHESEAAIWLASVLREEDPYRLLEMIGVPLEDIDAHLSD